MATEKSGVGIQIIQHHIGTNGCGIFALVGQVDTLKAHGMSGGTESGCEEKALTRSLSCERFEEILCTQEMYSVGCVPRVHIIGIGGVVTIIK